MTAESSWIYHSRQKISGTSAPPISQFRSLKPSDLIGAMFVLGCSVATGVAIYLSTVDHWLLWLLGQMLLAFAMLQWFVLIHEAGHKTLFRSAAWNKYGGHLASLLAGIPFESWTTVHALHHRWTGWQDLDATTATLVPRRLKLWERVIINGCWKLWIPLFSVLYRLQNYWNLPRLYKLFPRRKKRLRLTLNVFVLLAIYVSVCWLVGFHQILVIFALAAFLSLMMQDILILSQHTHIPMQLSQGEDVAPFTPAEQEFFTRSLEFPRWFSVLVLLNLDAHELHHIYPSVPGYYLSRIGYETHKCVPWWRWLQKAKQIPGEVFLFQNSSRSGFDI